MDLNGSLIRKTVIFAVGTVLGEVWATVRLRIELDGTAVSSNSVIKLCLVSLSCGSCWTFSEPTCTKQPATPSGEGFKRSESVMRVQVHAQ